MQVSPDVKKTVAMIFKKGNSKINFADGSPKLFVQLTSSFDTQNIKMKEGTSMLGKNEMLVGYEE